MANDIKKKLKASARAAVETYDGLIDIQIDAQLSRLAILIDAAKTRGSTVEQVASFISADIETGGGVVFGGMLKELDRIYTNASDELKSVNESIKLLGDSDDEDPLATWITGPNPCDACEALDGETRRMSEWVEHGLPGTVFSDGSNPCELYGAGCNCMLERA